MFFYLTLKASSSKAAMHCNCCHTACSLYAKCPHFYPIQILKCKIIQSIGTTTSVAGSVVLHIYTPVPIAHTLVPVVYRVAPNAGTVAPMIGATVPLAYTTVPMFCTIVPNIGTTYSVIVTKSFSIYYTLSLAIT